MADCAFEIVVSFEKYEIVATTFVINVTSARASVVR